MKKYDVVILDNTIIFPELLGNIEILNANKNNKDTHASLIYQILRNNIKVPFTTLNIDITHTMTLLDALKFISENIECKYINISAGIESCDLEYREKLYEYCNIITKKGGIIVAGGSNMGRITYPAAFDNVLSVDGSIFCQNIKDYEVVFSDIVNLRGFTGFQFIRFNKEIHKVAGTSFLVPRIIIELWKRNIVAQPIYTILERLKLGARKVYYKSDSNKNETNQLFAIKNAIVFPYNKEIINLIDNNDLLDFYIYNIYDYKAFGNVGKTINNRKILNFKNIDWNDNKFDALVLGHIQGLAIACGEDLLKYFIEKCIQYSKNIVTFDNLSSKNKHQLIKAGVKFYQASFNNYYLEEYKLRFGKLRYLSVPVVGIFGTSPKQGKFTLQMKLYRIFREYGYKVELFGTEPISSLIAHGESYPCGYGTNIEDNSYKQIQIINEKFFELENRGSELIIFSTQSQTVPAGFGNLGMYPIYQQNLLLASLPDAVILCVNYEDDKEYIRRTINFIEGISATKVIAISIFVFKRENNIKITREELDEKKAQLKGIYSGTIFFCEEYEKIAEEIINYLE